MWLIVVGAIVLIAGGVDLGWTTLGTHGGGPISAPLTKLIWKMMCGLHRRWPHHRALSFGGSIILIFLVAFWIAMVWIGWVLIFSGSALSIVTTQGRPVDLIERVYFVGVSMFTAGTSQYLPGSSVWRILTSFVNGSGVVVATLAVTYLLAVLAATVEKRSMASFIWDMGGIPERIIARAWDGERFTDLGNHLSRLGEALELFGEQHLAYPILQYFHSENRRTAAPLRIAALHDTLLLLGHGVEAGLRPPQLLMGSSLDSIRGFAEVVAGEFVTAPDDPPPLPDLGILRALGIPTVDDSTFRVAIENANDVRRRLLGMILDTGWTWEDAFDMNLIP
ncbi:MAG TPA: hypothetical protein VJ853_02325 [Thermoanaerobaculia bacterium]|nr:hypothetical protein [Thermoanaerobaculia bacterium]